MNKEIDLAHAVEITCSKCGKQMEPGAVFYSNPLLYEYTCPICNHKIRIGFKSMWFEVINKGPAQ